MKQEEIRLLQSVKGCIQLILGEIENTSLCELGM